MSDRLRPNVTPVNRPAMRLGSTLLLIVLSIPWFVGVWQIVRWILR